jgi:hypothetical protein
MGEYRGKGRDNKLSVPTPYRLGLETGWNPSGVTKRNPEHPTDSKEAVEEEEGRRNTIIVEECYGLPAYQCYVVNQLLAGQRKGKVKVLASW